MTLSLVSWAAVGIIAASLGVAWSRRFLAVGCLALANIAVFLLTLFGPVVPRAGIGSPRAVIQAELALQPDLLAAADPQGVLQLLTSMFVHADFFHLFGNLLVLFAFALPFEERIGHRKFLAIYLVTGLAGTMAQLSTSWGEPTYMMGASGAVFGIIGAFAGMFPRLVVPLPLPLLFIMVFVRMRVLVAATVFAAIQFLYLAWVNQDPTSPLARTAYLAHLGGLAAGLAIGLILARTRVGDPRRVVVDLTRLGPFATDPGATRALEQMQANQDEPAIFQAWLDRFFRTAQCPTCQGKVMPRNSGQVVCAKGHTFDIRRRADAPAPVAAP